MAGFGLVLAVLAFLGGLVGVMFSSQVSSGTSIVGFACLLAILARMAQASGHHETAMREARSHRKTTARGGLPSEVGADA